MIKLGLIGYPLGHSLSPQIHNAALKSCGLDGHYDRYPIHPDDRQALADLLSCVRSGEITGLNVTIPHKQTVIHLLDEFTSTAQRIGAVNTIYLRENKLIGDNTDAQGFLLDLKKILALKTQGYQDKHALVLGAGGSARAVVYALSQDGWNVAVAARRLEQAQELAKNFPNAFPMELNFETLQPANIQLIVNTTPIGMTPNIDASPLPGHVRLSKDTIVYDLIYNPQETKLVKHARAQGVAATTGLGMLIEQAALAFELWTGYSPSRDILRAAVE